MHSKTLEQWLTEFDELQKKFPGPVSNSLSFGDANSKNHLLVIAAIHGNETGSIPVIIEMAKKINALSFNFKMTFLIGNRQAVIANKRFITHDLNRIIKPNQETDPEHKRAQELVTIIQTASALLDMHQTRRVSKSPFYIFTPDTLSFALAGAFKATDMVIEDLSLAEHGEMSSVEFAQSLAIPAVAIELGQKGITKESYDVGWTILTNAIELFRTLKSDLQSELQLQNKASHLKKMKIILDIEVENEKDHLIGDLVNLSPVAAGQVIGKRASGADITVQSSGYVLFPQYPERHPNHMPLEPYGRVLCSIAVTDSPSLSPKPEKSAPIF